MACVWGHFWGHQSTQGLVPAYSHLAMGQRRKTKANRFSFGTDSLLYLMFFTARRLLLTIHPCRKAKRGKLWALLQRQKQLSGSIVPPTASSICCRRQWGKASLAVLWEVLQLLSFLRSIHLPCKMQFLLRARCPASEDLILYFCPSLA